VNYKFFYALIPFMLVIFSLEKNTCEAQVAFFQGAELQLGSGYRSGEMDWNIAGDSSGSNPDVLSELEWKDLDIFQTEAEGQAWLGSTKWPNISLYIKGSAAYGWVVDGDNRDSDYAGDHRTLEFSRSENDGDGGNLLDLSIAAGPQFKLWQGKLAIALLAGWSYHEQNLEISDGQQTLSEPGLAGSIGLKSPPAIGPISGLDSSYDTRWWGPWLGTDLSWQLSERATLCGALAWHFADYEAKANWNLRDDLAHPVSFRHYADGHGLTLGLGIEYQLNRAWLLELSYDYQDWQADDGNSYAYAASGGSGRTRLNEVNWRSHSALLSLGYQF
jgi:opacity protein-like surface antigen